MIWSEYPSFSRKLLGAVWWFNSSADLEGCLPLKGLHTNTVCGKVQFDGDIPCVSTIFGMRDFLSVIKSGPIYNDLSRGHPKW